MPSGGQSAADDKVVDYVMTCHKAAVENGLEREWWTFFLGGLADSGATDISLNADLACAEWDI